ncbi:MAG: hypothetical protein KKF95_04720, partial [Nanoarchaeota archaeon]|nr:hypothetical protein [Nanoarchaeota archaeon]
EADLKNNRRVLYVEAPFDKALKIIKLRGSNIITAKQLADARMQCDVSHSLSANGAYISEGIIVDPYPKHPNILLRESLILNNPHNATESHRKIRNYNYYHESYVVPSTIESVLNGLIEDKDYIFLDDRIGDHVISYTEFFEHSKLMNFLFGKSAKAYGIWLKEEGKISKVNIYNITCARRSEITADQLWFNRLTENSFFGGGRYLNHSNRVRWIDTK